MTEKTIDIYLRIDRMNPDPTPYKIYGAVIASPPDGSLYYVSIQIPESMTVTETRSGFDQVVFTPQGLVYVYNYLGFLAEQARRNQIEFNKAMLGE